MVIDIYNGSNVESILLIRELGKILFKGDEREICPVIEKNESEYLKPRVACEWLLQFHTPIELSSDIVTEWTEWYSVHNDFLSADEDYE